MKQIIETLDIEFSDNNLLSSLFGANDINIQTLEKINNVKIHYRGNKVKIQGSKQSIKITKNELLNLFDLFRRKKEKSFLVLKIKKNILNY